MGLVYDDIGDIYYVEKHNKYSSRRQKKNRKDNTKTRQAKIQSKDVKYGQTDINKNTYDQKTSYYNHYTTGDCEQIEQLYNKYVKKQNINDAFVNVLVDWGISHSLEGTRADEYLDFLFEKVALQIIKDGINLNDPQIIQNLYINARICSDYWYIPVNEVKFILANGGNPSILLKNLWEIDPMYSHDLIHNYQCELSVLIEAGAKLNSDKFIKHYVCNSWESSYKMDRVQLDPLIDDMTFETISNSIKSMFTETDDKFTLEYMISQGLDPNIQNGRALTQAINDYILFIGTAKYDDNLILERETFSIYEESNIYKLQWLTVCILIKYCKFSCVLRAYNIIDSMIPYHPYYEWNNPNGYNEHKNHIKTAIEFIRPCVIDKRIWAAMTIQRAWRNAISNPRYTLCATRLNNEFNALCSKYKLRCSKNKVCIRRPYLSHIQTLLDEYIADSQFA